jgi:NAD(P)-dependent dehydrogenase (short-subunit alcohol dehydrogenase family)
MEKKIVLITGAGRRQGLGFATAKEFGKLGYHVIITARNIEQIEPLAQELNNMGYETEAMRLDLLDEESIENVAKQIKVKYDRLDVLVNNAAMLWNSSMGTMDEISNEELRMEVETNFIGTWIVTRAMHPLLKASGNGRVVNVSSGAGSYHDPEFGLLHNAETTWPVSLYGITKLAINGMTIKAAKEFKQDNILVNAICPGVMATYEESGFAGRNPEISAREGVVWAATLPDDGPTGGFFRDGKELPW